MALTTWRQDQLWALATLMALSLGAGFAGGYFSRAGTVVPAIATSDATRTAACSAQACAHARVKSYERLLEEAERFAPADEMPAAERDEHSAAAPAICEEVPMDGLLAMPDGTRFSALDGEPPCLRERQ